MSTADRQVLERLLAHHHACIVEKKHPAEVAPVGDVDNTSDRIHRIGADAHVDTQELLLVSDVLVTDYSGCFLDYLLLDRPVIHFAYDRDQYSDEDRGLYFDLDEIAGGPIVTSVDELMSALERSLADRGAEATRRQTVRDRLLAWERGTASATIAEQVLGSGRPGPSSVSSGCR